MKGSSDSKESIVGGGLGSNPNWQSERGLFGARNPLYWDTFKTSQSKRFLTYYVAVVEKKFTNTHSLNTSEEDSQRIL